MYMEDSTKMDIEDRGDCGLNSSGSGQGSVEDSCECGNEPSCSTKCMKCLTNYGPISSLMTLLTGVIYLFIFNTLYYNNSTSYEPPYDITFSILLLFPTS